MNKFVLGALALTASSAPTLAGTGTEEWTKLDKDIESLASSLAPQSSGVAISGFLKTSYASSSDVTIVFDPDGGGPAPAENHDLGGFSLDNVRLNFDGTVGSFGVHIGVEGSTEGALAAPSHWTGLTGTGGAVGVLDAYATFRITNEIGGQTGQFRAPFFGESMHDEDQLLFMDRSLLGQVFAARDLGLQVGGQFNQLGAKIAVMNGADGPGDEHMITGRVDFTVMGAAPTVEGAYAATGQQNLSLGAGYLDDANIDDATAWCLDANFGMGAVSAMAGMVDLDDGLGDATPWMAQVGFMFVPNQWEAGLRFEDLDDSNDTSNMTFGVNYYVSGHAAKVQLNFSQIDSDLGDADMMQVGMTASI